MPPAPPAPAPLARVLVPTDLSRGADNAARRAARLPLARGAGLELLHVRGPGVPARLRARLTAAARDELAAVRARIEGALARAGRGDVRVRVHVATGEAFVEIVRRARATRAELIVVARHGRRPLADVDLGTTAERVIRHAEAPVLVASLPASAAYARPLVAAGGGDAVTRAVATAARLLGADAPRVRVVHACALPFGGPDARAIPAREQAAWRRRLVDEARARADAQARAWRDATGLDLARPAVKAGDPRAVVFEEALRREADLVVLATHDRGGAVPTLLGGAAEWIVAAAPGDVLIARPPGVRLALP